MSGRLHSINVSRGGVPKLPVTVAWIDRLGVDGDAQADREHHGGPERAVCVYSLERIEALAREGHPIFIGSTGENLTVAGVEWDVVKPGDHITVGEIELEVTDFTAPCRTIADSFRDRRFKRISHKLHPGWSRVYARVVRPGFVSVGDEVSLGRSIRMSIGRLP